MQMKDKSTGTWRDMYPITKSENVFMDTGETLQEFTDNFEVRTGAIDNQSDTYQSAFYTVFPGGYCMLSYSGVKMTDATNNGYIRAYVEFPFSLSDNYSVTATIRSGVDGSYSVSETQELHARLHRNDRVQISSRKPSGNYEGGEFVVVDVQIMGLME